MTVRNIELRGVRVHNLKNIDLDVPHRQLIVICGVSGSGKTSLALDTLYAEGQRRYIESFSAYTRQFLDQFEKPAADRIDGIPPAIAVTRAPTSRSSRSTVGTATEIADYLRLLYAKIGRIRCYQCGRAVNADTPQSVVDQFADLADGRRLMIAFPRTLGRSAVGCGVGCRVAGGRFCTRGDRRSHGPSQHRGGVCPSPAMVRGRRSRHWSWWTAS